MPLSIEKPIIILGAARSGTGLLISAVGQHEDIAFLDEPNYIWKYRSAYLRHDMIPPSHATERVKGYIQAKFLEACRQQGKARFAEKTPANGLRLPFVLEVFPDAKIVHIIRDGRDATVSAYKKYLGNWRKITSTGEAETLSAGSKRYSFSGSVVEKIQAAHHLWRSGTQRIGQIPAHDALYYVPKAINTVLGNLGLRSSYLWGPVFPGMRQLMSSHDLIEVCALQWRTTVENALNTVAARPGVDYHEIKFESFVDSYEETMRSFYDFAELS